MSCLGSSVTFGITRYLLLPCMAQLYNVLSNHKYCNYYLPESLRVQHIVIFM